MCRTLFVVSEAGDRLLWDPRTLSDSEGIYKDPFMFSAFCFSPVVSFMPFENHVFFSENVSSERKPSIIWHLMFCYCM